MARYYIESYTKERQSFLARLNSMSETTGVIKEPYIIRLKKVMFFGLITYTFDKKVYLPKGFNAERELIKGREYAL